MAAPAKEDSIQGTSHLHKAEGEDTTMDASDEENMIEVLSAQHSSSEQSSSTKRVEEMPGRSSSFKRDEDMSGRSTSSKRNELHPYTQTLALSDLESCDA
jgi:hypothetical protein